MKFKSLIKLSSLVLILGITIQTFSQSKKSNIMDNTKNEKIGLLVIMKAKEGKEQEVKEFLLGGLSLVNAEPKTESWFAFQIDEQTFGIYDTFEAEEGRQAHLKGEVAKALLANAGDLLEGFFSMFPILYSADLHFSKKSCASLIVFNLFGSSALNCLPSRVVNSAIILKEETLLKLMISFSLSTISFRATDCPLPADSPGFIFFHKIGESSKPTNLSKILRACCAFIKF